MCTKLNLFGQEQKVKHSSGALTVRRTGRDTNLHPLRLLLSKSLPIPINNVAVSDGPRRPCCHARVRSFGTTVTPVPPPYLLVPAPPPSCQHGHVLGRHLAKQQRPRPVKEGVLAWQPAQWHARAKPTHSVSAPPTHCLPAPCLPISRMAEPCLISPSILRSVRLNLRRGTAGHSRTQRGTACQPTCRPAPLKHVSATIHWLYTGSRMSDVKAHIWRQRGLRGGGLRGELRGGELRGGEGG